MRVKDLIRESDVRNQLPKNTKQQLRNKLKGLFDVIENFEKNGEIHRDDKDRIETFKDFISDMVEEKDRNKIIRGES